MKPQFLIDVIYNRLHTRIVMLLIYFFSFFIVIMSIENWIGFQSVYTRQYAMDCIDILSSRFFFIIPIFVWHFYLHAHFFSSGFDIVIVTNIQILQYFTQYFTHFIINTTCCLPFLFSYHH